MGARNAPGEAQSQADAVAPRSLGFPTFRTTREGCENCLSFSLGNPWSSVIDVNQTRATGTFFEPSTDAPTAGRVAECVGQDTSERGTEGVLVTGQRHRMLITRQD